MTLPKSISNAKQVQYLTACRRTRIVIAYHYEVQGILAFITGIGIVPIVRTTSAESAIQAVEAIYRGACAPPRSP